MCRNIKTLANFEPPATGDEIRASALQFVRKLSGMNKPSRANEAAFNRAVEDVTAAAGAADRVDLHERTPAESRGGSAESAGARPASDSPEARHASPSSSPSHSDSGSLHDEARTLRRPAVRGAVQADRRTTRSCSASPDTSAGRPLPNVFLAAVHFLLAEAPEHELSAFYTQPL